MRHRRRWHRPHGLGHYVRARLHRRLFVWFGVTIFVTGGATFATMTLFFSGPSSYRNGVERLKTYAENRFTEVWSDAPARQRLADALLETSAPEQAREQAALAMRTANAQGIRVGEAQARKARGKG